MNNFKRINDSDSDSECKLTIINHKNNLITTEFYKDYKICGEKVEGIIKSYQLLKDCVINQKHREIKHSHIDKNIAVINIFIKCKLCKTIYMELM